VDDAYNKRAGSVSPAGSRLPVVSYHWLACD